MKKKFLVIIPARSQSKGIKNKNLSKISSLSLVEFKHKLAVKSFKKKNSMIILSTDSSKYKSYFQKRGIKVPFLRPEKLALDKTESKPVIMHALNYFNKLGIDFEYVVLLEPATPFTTKNTLHKAIRELDKRRFDLMASVSESHINSNFIAYLDHKNSLLPMLKKIQKFKAYQRQAHMNEYSMDGGFYIFSVTYLNNFNKLFNFDKKIKSFAVIAKKFEGLNIENLDDLKFARLIYSNNRNINTFFSE